MFTTENKNIKILLFSKQIVTMVFISVFKQIFLIEYMVFAPFPLVRRFYKTPQTQVHMLVTL